MDEHSCMIFTWWRLIWYWYGFIINNEETEKCIYTSFRVQNLTNAVKLFVHIKRSLPLMPRLIMVWHWVSGIRYNLFDDMINIIISRKTELTWIDSNVSFGSDSTVSRDILSSWVSIDCCKLSNCQENTALYDYDKTVEWITDKILDLWHPLYHHCQLLPSGRRCKEKYQ